MSLVPGIMCIFLACSTPPTVPASFKPDEAQYALRGDPNFSEDSLSAEQRKWYDRLWAAIKNPDQYPNATEMAKSGNSYLYRGDLQDYDNALLTAFRLTGDLRLLDEVSRISELMRKELKDAWHGTRDGTNGKTDGFRNWVDLYDSDKKFRGKDTQMAFDLKANAHVALFAWAFENNRDFQSPGGYDYGKQADFWKDYLVNDFEAKWRKRNDKPKVFPFAEVTGFHTYHSFMKWHYYMGKLTGNNAYTKEAERMATILWKDEFTETSSGYGTALVWPRDVQAISTDTKQNYMMPTTYAHTVLQEVVDLHFEGFNKYAEPSALTKIARSVADFVIDKDSFDSFARDIGGGKARAGIRASNSSDWSRKSMQNFAESAWSYLATWDSNSNNRIKKAAEQIYQELDGGDGTPKRVFIPTGMFIKAMLK